MLIGAPGPLRVQDSSPSWRVRNLGLQAHCRPDLEVAQQEGPLVEPLSPEPAGDLLVALAGVACAAGRHDVVERVSPAPRDGEYAVALQRLVGRTAVRAPTPSRLECRPLLIAQVVLDAIHAAFASAGGASLPTTIDRHSNSVRSALPDLALSEIKGAPGRAAGDAS